MVAEPELAFRPLGATKKMLPGRTVTGRELEIFAYGRVVFFFHGAVFAGGLAD